MEQEFWQNRWKDGKIAFHEARPNRFLEAHFENLKLKRGSKIFVPLCGKAIDLDLLFQKGMTVVGAELNEAAAMEVFSRQGLSPAEKSLGSLKQLSSEKLTIFVGDFFDLSADQIGTVAAVYNRAALVALPDLIRKKYTQHLAKITHCARQLVITYDYDQRQTDGPPFSVPVADVENQYTQHYDIEKLSSATIEGPLAERCTGHEIALMLSKR